MQVPYRRRGPGGGGVLSLLVGVGAVLAAHAVRAVLELLIAGVHAVAVGARVPAAGAALEGLAEAQLARLPLLVGLGPLPSGVAVGPLVAGLAAPRPSCLPP